MEQIIKWMPALLKGTTVTLVLTVTSVVMGLILGLFLALGKISRNKVLQKLCGAYIFFFRGTPLLMQLYFIYYGLPLISRAFVIESKFLVAFIAFAMNSAAYCAENIRAAIESIDKGQMEAAKTLGLSYPQAMRLIIIPQSYRRLIPPIGNEFIMVLKDTAIVSVIALTDLMSKTQQIQATNGSPLVYVPVALLYLLLTFALTKLFAFLEKKHSNYE